ncbi:MAG: hypothetical protein U1C57_01605 [Candidatus Doudnabacteria bacterium]|nr:hypothetical protein [Candidatus Doudnabacteria bacterium]
MVPNNYPTPPKPIFDVSAGIWDVVRERFKRWGFVAVSIAIVWVVGFWLIVWYYRLPMSVETIGVFLFPFLAFVGAVWEMVDMQVRQSFWKQFAARKGWSFEPWSRTSLEFGAMFREGEGREISNVVSGPRSVRIFTYTFYKKRFGEKNSRTYNYTVFAFKFNGHFPHIYLDRIGNPYTIKVGKQISVPVEFKEKFRLSAPEGYEIEALQIFTPELLAFILDSSLKHDVELVNQELLLYVPGKIDNLDELEKEFSEALTMANKFAPVLDSIQFQRIGDKPYVLKQ